MDIFAQRRPGIACLSAEECFHLGFVCREFTDSCGELTGAGLVELPAEVEARVALQLVALGAELTDLLAGQFEIDAETGGAGRTASHGRANEDVARLCPLKHANLNFLGRYGFAARPPREGLRPLRDPATVHLDEDDEGTGE